MEAFHLRLRKTGDEQKRRNTDWFGNSNGGISSRMTTDDHCINKIIDHETANHIFPLSGGTVKVFKRALLSLWVQRYFPPKAQEALLEMWSTFRSTLENVFKQSTWMDATAKKNAIGKLSKIKYSGAYNEEILNEASMQAYHDTFLVESMDPNAFVENQVNF